MNKVGTIEWYAYQPLMGGIFYGTADDWNETIVTKINQANASLFQNALKNLSEGDNEVLAKNNPKKKLIIASNLVDLITSLDVYYIIIDRYNVAFSKGVEEGIIHLVDGDYFVEIKVINKHKPHTPANND